MMHKYEMALRTGQHGQHGNKATSQYPLLLLANIPALKDAPVTLDGHLVPCEKLADAVPLFQDDNLSRMQSQPRHKPELLRPVEGTGHTTNFKFCSRAKKVK